jgi:hypothetical protein
MAVGRKDPRSFRGVFKYAIPFSGTVTLTAAAGAETSASVTVAGAANGDAVIFGLLEDTEDGVLTANVNTAGAVEFTLVNATASTITIASATVKGVVLGWDDEVGIAGE